MSFSLTPSKKYTIIEEFRAKKFKNHIRRNKRTEIIKNTRNKWNRKWSKKKAKCVRWWNKQYLTKVRCEFNNFRNKT